MEVECLTEYEIRQRYGYVPPDDKSLRDTVKDAVKCDRNSAKTFLVGFFPILTWLSNYSIKDDLPGDIVGGLTTAIVRIPQSLAYAILAKVAPVNGLYTAFFSPLAYTFLGTSRHLSIGTFAVVSIMVGSAQQKFISANPLVSSPAYDSHSNVATSAYATTTLSTTGIQDEEDFSSDMGKYKLAVVFSITLLVGVIQIIMGIFNLGFVALFLSDPLVSGFTTGAAIYVFTAQVKYFFGIDMGRHQAPFALGKTYYELLTRIGETKWEEVVISVVTIVLLYPVKLINVKYKKQLRNIPIPMELIIVVIATIISANADFEAKGIEVVGVIPKGLPAPVLPQISYWPSLITDAISIAVVSFAITVSIGKLFANKHGYKISPNQELFALGVSQVACGFFRGYAGSGSLSRSSVKESSGTKTQFSGIVSCIVMLLVLLFIGPFLEPLPVACLSSIILVNVRTLFNQFDQLPKLWKLCKYDFSIWIITFVATVFISVDMGLIIGVAALLASVVIRKYNVTGTISGKLGPTSIYGDFERYETAEVTKGIRIIRFGESPFFGNKENLEVIGFETANLKRKYDSRKASSRIKRKEPELSQALLDGYSSESDSDVKDKHPNGKHTEKSEKLSPYNDYVVVVDSKTGEVKYTSNATTSALSSSGSLASSGGGRSGNFHTVIFDCSAWTFIDTMGMNTVKQMCKEFEDLNLRVHFAALQPKVLSQLSKSNVFDVGGAVPYPSVDFAVKAAMLQSRCCETPPTETVQSEL